MTDPRKILSPLARLVFGAEAATRGPRRYSNRHPSMTIKQVATMDELLRRGNPTDTATALGISPSGLTQYVRPTGNGKTHQKLLDFAQEAPEGRYDPDVIKGVLSGLGLKKKPPPDSRTRQELLDAVAKSPNNLGDAAKNAGMSYVGMAQALKRENIPTNFRTGPPPKSGDAISRAKMLNLYEQGVPIDEIAAQFNMSRDTAYKRIKHRKGWKSKPKSKNTVSAEQVAETLQRLNGNQAATARELGISLGTVYKRIADYNIPMPRQAPPVPKPLALYGEPEPLIDDSEMESILGDYLSGKFD